MEAWLHDSLSSLLGFDLPEEMVKHILSLKDGSEFDQYFKSLLNKDSEEHRAFLLECKQRLFAKALPTKRQSPSSVSQKKFVESGSSKIKQNITTSNQSSMGKVKPDAEDAGNPQAGKKKTKFVSLYTSDGRVAGETILLKGRRLCECQAAEHLLINNCLNCGRVVCMQEGSGPCLFCGELVCSIEEMKVLKENSKKAKNLLKSLKGKGGGAALQKALEQRDRLLDYDRNSESRTTVIDDELDYFEENSVWLSDVEREKFERLKSEMHEKKHAGRAKRQIRVDFAGREIEDVAQITEEYEQSVLKEIATTSAHNNAHKLTGQKAESRKGANESDVDPNIDASSYRPVWTAKAVPKTEKSDLDGVVNLDSYNRVQDRELLEMQDMRNCLSMHQPYASLLVAGIKKHEGRVWYTEHRGRLWIASTAQEPKQEDITEVEDFYRRYYNDPNLKFPEHYPTGCLLGCVQVVDCLAQEEYRDDFPKGESESPYVFICVNPEELPVVFPIKGKHKIYKIDPQIHNAACKTLMRSNKGKA